MVEAINNVNVNNIKSQQPTNVANVVDEDKSIFLEEALANVKDKQGFIGESWNGVKELFNSGLSESDCENVINKYKNGEVTYEEAMATIKGYEVKQSTMTDLFSNIFTGIASIVVATAAVAGGPIGWLTAALLGAPVGAAVKTGLKIVDRATNDVKGDEFDKKLMLKDAISGALTGTTSAVSSGIGAGIRTGNVMLSVKNGAKCGAICGGLSGAGNYLTDVAFGDKYFNAGDLVKDTLTSAFVSGTVGAVVGAGVYGLTDKASYLTQSVKQTIITDSASSSSRKILNVAEREALGIIKA
ncbi:hypothetical protein IKJ53_02125 [bacterium]|nr:hypothetical protein [bacterium]